MLYQVTCKCGKKAFIEIREPLPWGQWLFCLVAGMITGLLIVRLT